MSVPILDGLLQSDLDCGGNDLANIGTLSISGLTASRALVTNGSGGFAVATTTSTEIGYVNGVTSAIQTQLNARLLKAGDTMTGLLVLSGNPVTALGAATKQYVDSAAAGLDPKDSVAAATTANITLSGAQTIDAVSIVATRRVLVKNQSDATQNGIYEAQSGAWNRSTDADTDAEVTSGMYCFVEEGTVNGDTGFVLTTNDPITLGVTSLVFSPFTAASTTTASLGVTKVGNDFRLDSSYSATFVALNLSGLAASRVLYTDASKNLAASTVTDTELGYLSGVTSAIQTQLGARLLKAGDTMTGLLVLSGDPAAALGAATKQYVDSLSGSVVAIHTPVKAATTANITLSGNQTIDGVACVTTERVLVKDQSSGNQNGIYLVAAGSWTRAMDMDTSGETVAGMIVGVSEGTVNGNSLFQLTTNAPLTLDTTALVFARSGPFSAGTALTLSTSGVFALDATASPTLAGLTVSGLNASRAMVTGASKELASSATTATEVGYLSGVTSAIQTQFTGKLSLGGGTMTGFLVLNADPSTALHATTKQYVDALVGGTAITVWKQSVRAATTANITLSGAQTIDGVSVIATDRVLVKNQSTGSQNGIYVAAAGSWSRAADADSDAEVLSGMTCHVSEGTANADTVWHLTTNAAITLNTTALVFTRLYTAGTGLALTAAGVFSFDASSSPTLTGLTLSGVTVSRALVSSGASAIAAATTTATEIGYVNGVTSAIQTQLDAKLPLAGGTLSGNLTISTLTASRALVTDGSKVLTSATTTATEIGYVNGVTSAIQSQINAISAGISIYWKDAARVASTANLTLSGEQTVDGVAAVTGNRILVKDQSSGAENGVYVVDSGSWTRSGDADTSAEVKAGVAIHVSEGTVNANTLWQLTTNDAITLGSTALVFARYAPYTAGTGVAISAANAISLDASSSPTLTNLTLSGLTASRALVSDGSKVITAATTTSTEIGYVNGVTSAIQTQLDALKIVGQNSQSTAYTTVLGDAGKHILHPTADNNARTFTIDSNANVAYPTGTVITFVNQINTVTIAITSDTLTLYPAGTTGSRTLAASGQATALKIGTTSWTIAGVGLT